ncbi:MAG: Gfo/Idh/MocA family oxidoreductase [bacterium]|nr:Gfo/Idh/MocA family oxidoreductase [bacterium]
MKKVKWGVLGTAGIAKSCTIPGMMQAENCELYAIAGRDPKKVDAYRNAFGFAKSYTDYDELLQDEEIEAVYVPLPNHLHYEWVMKAIEAGKNILCEKPLAPKAEQVAELFEAAKEKGVILMEAFAYLHTPYIDALKKEIDDRTIGDVSYIEAAFLTSSYHLTNIRMQKECFGGATYDLGCYCTSMILRMLEKEPITVQGVAEFSDEKVDILTTAIMNFGDGVRANFTCGMNFEKEQKFRFDRLYIHGSKGTIKSDTKFNEEGDLNYTICVDGKEEVKTVPVLHNYRLEVEQLGRCIANGEKPHVSEAFSLMNARTLDKVLDAINY